MYLIRTFFTELFFVGYLALFPYTFKNISQISILEMELLCCKIWMNLASINDNIQKQISKVFSSGKKSHSEISEEILTKDIRLEMVEWNYIFRKWHIRIFLGFVDNPQVFSYRTLEWTNAFNNFTWWEINKMYFTFINTKDK